MRNEALIINLESNIDERVKVITDWQSRFNARVLDRLQDEVIGQLLNREFFNYDITDSFHRTWDSIDVERKSLACLYEQHRARFFTFTEVCGTFKDLEESGDLFLVTVSSPRWKIMREGLECVPARELKSVALLVVKNLKEHGLRPAMYGFVHLIAVEHNESFYWQAEMRLLFGRCEKSRVDLALQEFSRTLPAFDMSLTVEDTCVDDGLDRVSDFTPQLQKRPESSLRRDACGLAADDLVRRSIWMAQQKFRDMVICFGMPKGTRQALYDRSLEEIAMDFII